MIVQLPIGLVQSNTYLVYDEEQREGAIVDPGGKIHPLVEEIEERDVKVRYILLTHGHFDHIAGNAGIKSEFNVPLGVHPDDRDLVIEGGGASMFEMAYVPSPEPDFDLTDGLRLELGKLHIEVIHTPGHTPGSVCLYVPEEQALLTGDTLFAGSVGRTDLPGGHARKLTNSLRKLMQLPPETHIYPGHGPRTTLRRQMQSNPWLQRIDPDKQPR